MGVGNKIVLLNAMLKVALGMREDQSVIGGPSKKQQCCICHAPDDNERWCGEDECPAYSVMWTKWGECKLCEKDPKGKFDRKGRVIPGAGYGLKDTFKLPPGTMFENDGKSGHKACLELMKAGDAEIADKEPDEVIAMASQSVTFDSVQTSVRSFASGASVDSRKSSSSRKSSASRKSSDSNKSSITAWGSQRSSTSGPEAADEDQVRSFASGASVDSSTSRKSRKSSSSRASGSSRKSSDSMKSSMGSQGSGTSGPDAADEDQEQEEGAAAYNSIKYSVRSSGSSRALGSSVDGASKGASIASGVSQGSSSKSSRSSVSSVASQDSNGPPVDSVVSQGSSSKSSRSSDSSAASQDSNGPSIDSVVSQGRSSKASRSSVSSVASQDSNGPPVDSVVSQGRSSKRSRSSVSSVASQDSNGPSIDSVVSQGRSSKRSRSSGSSVASRDSNGPNSFASDVPQGSKWSSRKSKRVGSSRASESKRECVKQQCCICEAPDDAGWCGEEECPSYSVMWTCGGKCKLCEKDPKGKFDRKGRVIPGAGYGLKDTFKLPPDTMFEDDGKSGHRGCLELMKAGDAEVADQEPEEVIAMASQSVTFDSVQASVRSFVSGASVGSRKSSSSRKSSNSKMSTGSASSAITNWGSERSGASVDSSQSSVASWAS